MKILALTIGNVNDTINTIGALTPNVTVQSFADDTLNDYYLEDDMNGQSTLCIEVPDATGDIDANLSEYGTGNAYDIVSQNANVIGGRPNVRCPKCNF